MAEVQTQPMEKPAATPVVQGTQENVPPKQSSFMKWLLLIVGILILVGGLSYWILAP